MWEDDVRKLRVELRIEFWWALERLSGWLWDKFCPAHKAAYWMDPIPAFFYIRRKNAEKCN